VTTLRELIYVKYFPGLSVKKMKCTEIKHLYCDHKPNTAGSLGTRKQRCSHYDDPRGQTLREAADCVSNRFLNLYTDC
jgi:hypothetical protein